MEALAGGRHPLEAPFVQPSWDLVKSVVVLNTSQSEGHAAQRPSGLTSPMEFWPLKFQFVPVLNVWAKRYMQATEPAP